MNMKQRLYLTNMCAEHIFHSLLTSEAMTQLFTCLISHIPLYYKKNSGFYRFTVCLPAVNYSFSSCQLQIQMFRESQAIIIMSHNVINTNSQCRICKIMLLLSYHDQCKEQFLIFHHMFFVTSEQSESVRTCHLPSVCMCLISDLT